MPSVPTLLPERVVQPQGVVPIQGGGAMASLAADMARVSEVFGRRAEQQAVLASTRAKQAT